MVLVGSVLTGSTAFFLGGSLKLPGLPGTPSLPAPLGRDWAPDDEAGPPPAPFVPVTGATLEPALRGMYAEGQG
jgi:hypothetical protein